MEKCIVCHDDLLCAEVLLKFCEEMRSSSNNMKMQSRLPCGIELWTGARWLTTCATSLAATTQARTPRKQQNTFTSGERGVVMMKLLLGLVLLCALECGLGKPTSVTRTFEGPNCTGTPFKLEVETNRGQPCQLRALLLCSRVRFVETCRDATRLALV
jgi:hypothetical protein